MHKIVNKIRNAFLRYKAVQSVCIVLLGFLVLQPREVFCRDGYIFEKFNSSDGLTSNQVNCIMQDSLGFMWFGTKNGLFLFDGTNFTCFVHDPDDSTSISNDYVLDLEPLNNKGDLLVATRASVCFFSRETFSFSKLPVVQREKAGSFYRRSCMAIERDIDGNFWLGTSLGIMVLNDKFEKIAFLKDGPSIGLFQHHNITDILCDRKGRTIVGTMSGVDECNLRSDSVVRRLPELSNKYITRLFEDDRGNIWIGTRGKGLYMLPDGNFDNELMYFGVENGKLLNNRPSEIIQDVDGSYLISDRDGGLVKLGTEFDDPRFIVPEANNPHSLSSQALTSLFLDKENNIWVGTFSVGLNFVDRGRKNFDHFMVMDEHNNALNSKIRSLHEDIQGNIWVGTKEGGGLNKFNRENGTFENYFGGYGKNNGLSDSYVLCIEDLDEDRLIVGTFKKGFDIFNKRTKTFVNGSLITKTPLANRSVYAIHKHIDGKIWFGTRAFLQILDPKTNEFQDIKDIIKPQVFCHESDSSLWVGTQKGDVYLVNTKTLAFKRVFHKSFINALVFDKSGNLWIGTDDNGIFLLDKEQNTIDTLSTKHGLPHKSVKGILVDCSDNIWVSTEYGLAKYDKNKKEFLVFNEEDGLQDNSFNTFVALKTSDGRIWFGGNNGFNGFYPDSIKSDKSMPKVVLTGLKIFNEQVDFRNPDAPIKKHISLADKIVLSHKQSVFTIDFIALEYSASKDINYAYKLENFDKEWLYTGNRHDATFTNIPPGNYTFRVKACNADGFWDDKGVEIAVRVLPPWWNTRWFKIFTVLFIISLLFAVYYLRVHQLIRHKVALEKKVADRTAEIAAKNKMLLERTTMLNENNSLLLERQSKIEEQAEEMSAQAEVLCRSNDQLSQLNATKDKLFSIIAHDLKDPFSAIIGFSSLLTKRYDILEQTKIKQYLRSIESSANNVYNLLENLLQWARTQQGRVSVNPESIKVYETIEGIKELLSERLDKKELKIVNSIPADLEILIDRNIFQTILRNFIANAAKYSENCNIDVYSKVTHDKVMFFVRDYGIGMEKEAKEKLLQVDTLKSKRGTQGEKGTGLGLLICRDFAEYCNGEIGFESGPEKGSTFYVSFKAETLVPT